MSHKYGKMAKIAALALVATVVVCFSIRICKNGKQQNVESQPVVQDTTFPESEDVLEYESSETVESQVIDLNAPTEFQIHVANYELTCVCQVPETVIIKTRDNAEITCDVEFYALIEDTEVPAFSMDLQDNKGDITTVCTDENGASMIVSFTMYALPEELEESNAKAFYVAQDFVNTLTAALKVKTIHEPQKDSQDQTQSYTVGGFEISFGEVNLKDIQIWVEEQELVFSVLLPEAEELFRLRINSDEGDIVKYLPDTAENLIPVAFEMIPMPEDLDANDASTFFRAQELVNDVMQTVCILQ